MSSFLRVLGPVGLLVLGACATTVEQRGGAPPAEGAPAAAQDPLDTAPEGEPVCTKEGFCWDYPYAPSSIASLHASSPTALWAVGSGGTILRSRSGGAAWRRFPAPTAAGLRGVFAVDMHTAWAVGDEGTLLSFDGTAWKKLAVALPPKTTLHAVWASSATDAYAVGTEEEAGSGVVVHFDGLAWVKLSERFPSLRAVHGKGPSEVWVAGGRAETPELRRWDGTKWSTIDVLDLAGSRSIYGPAVGVHVNGDNDALVVTGEINTSSIARYTGTWKIEHTMSRDREGALSGFGRGPGGAPWAIGNPPLARNEEGAWARASNQSFDGVRAIWSFDDGPTVLAGDDGLLDASGSAPERPRSPMATTSLTAPWALTDEGLFRFVEGRWKRALAAVRRAGWQESFLDAVQRSETDLFVVSVEYPDDYEAGGPRHFMRSWNGTAWTLAPLPDGNYGIGTVARSSSGDLWIASANASGTSGVVHRTAAGADVPIAKCAGDTYATPIASKVWAIGDEVILAGYRGIYRVAPSGACTFVPTSGILSDKESIFAMDGLSPGDLWLVAHDASASQGVGKVYRLQGSVLRAVKTGATDELTNVRALEGGDVVFVGARSLQRWDGASIREIPTGLAEDDAKLALVWGRAAGDLRFVGSGGRILRKR